jgi:hypothetical protein
VTFTNGATLDVKSRAPVLAMLSPTALPRTASAWGLRPAAVLEAIATVLVGTTRRLHHPSSVRLVKTTTLLIIKVSFVEWRAIEPRHTVKN